MEWFAAMLVDGKPYLLLGSAAESNLNMSAAAQTQQVYTATQTSYLLTAGPMNVNMTFLSPLEVSSGGPSSSEAILTIRKVSNLTRLSVPFSYLQITVEPNDGNSHDVQIYSDVYGGEFSVLVCACLSLTCLSDWICADNTSPLNWTANVDDGFTFLQMEYVNPVPFQESQDLPRDGSLYYAAKNVGTVLFLFEVWSSKGYLCRLAV